MILSLALWFVPSIRAIPYVEHGTPDQVLDLFVPATKPFKTVVFTYGGGWHSPRSKSVDQIANAFVAMGYGCVLVSHRLGPQNQFPAQAEDLASAFAWTRSHIAGYGGNASQVFLVGHSSGAELSLLIATDPKYLAAQKLSVTDIAGVIGLSTPTDLAPKQSGVGFGNALMSGHGADTFGRNIQLMRDASPIVHLAKGQPKTLLIVGSDDLPGLPEDAQAYAAAAALEGVSCEVMTVPNCDHLGTIAGFVDPKTAIRAKVAEFLAK